MINLIVRTNKRTKPKPSFNLKKKKLSSTLTPSFTHNTASILLRLPSRGNKNLLHASTLLQTLNSNGIHRTSPFLDPNLVAGTHGVETHDSPRLFSNSHLNYVQFIAYSGRSFRNDGTTVSRLPVRRLLQSFDFQLRQSTQLMYSIYSRGNFTSMPLP